MKKLSKKDKKDLIQLSKILRREQTPPYDEGYITALPNGAARKRRRTQHTNLASSYRPDGVSEVDKAIANLFACGIHLLKIGEHRSGCKAVFVALYAKGCNFEFIRRILAIIDKFPKLVLDSAWASAELMSDRLVYRWLPGWEEADISAVSIKFPGPKNGNAKNSAQEISTVKKDISDTDYFISLSTNKTQ